MKVVLINPPQHTNYPQPPMGLALLGAILEKKWHDVRIVDANVESVDGIEADVVGITAMTPTINSALQIARTLKRQNPKVKIILGGMHVSLMPKETLNEFIDVVVVGEGDAVVNDVIQNGAKGVFQNSQQVDMDSLPFTAVHRLALEKYKPHPPHGRAFPFLPMLTSRGCPYRCIYCAGSVFGKKFRAQSPIRVVDEMEYYVTKFGVKEIAFYDDVFTLDAQRVHGIADEILKRNLKVIWSCEARVNLVDKELLWHMKQAGCYSVAYGIESGSETILKSLDKDITLQQVYDAVRISRGVGLETVGYFMIGSPAETPQTIEQTIRFAQELKLDYAQFSVTTPFPGTRLYKQYFNGKHPDWDSFVYAGTGSKVSPVFESDKLSRQDIESYASRAYKQFYMRPAYVWQRLSGIRSIGDIKVLAKGLSMLRGM